MKQAARDRLDELNKEVYGIPFPVDHFYMPVATEKRIVEFDIDRRTCVPEGDIVDLALIRSFLSKLRLSEAEIAKVPHWQTAANLALGMGYPGVDAYIYYSAILKLRPPTIVEIGCGMSTYYASLALEQNGQSSDSIFCFEPFPRQQFVHYCASRGVNLNQERIESIDISKITSRLTNNSILFVDSTHAFRADGELPRIILEILPHVPAGCHVHFHNIFLPNSVIFREHSAFSFSHVWNESIALAAFLSGRSDYRTVLPTYWMGVNRYDELSEYYPWLQTERMLGASFWMERI